jgi:hypothetical protein
MHITVVLRHQRRLWTYNTLRWLPREEQVQRLKYSDLKDTKRLKGYGVLHRYKLRTAITPIFHQTFWAYNGWRCRCCGHLFCLKEEDDYLYRHYVADMAHAALAIDPLTERRRIEKALDNRKYLIRLLCRNEAGEPLICYRCQDKLEGRWGSELWDVTYKRGPHAASVFLAARAYLAWHDWWKRGRNVYDKPF